MNKIIVGAIGISAVGLGWYWIVFGDIPEPVAEERAAMDQPMPDELRDDMTACTMDAMLCPDGSSVGREGPDCEFAACPAEPVPDDVQAQIDEKAENIIVNHPPAGSYIASPLRISGEARGMWFFEGDFPVQLTDWNGEIIAEHFVTADDEWMTEDFVPFSGELDFVSPVTAEYPDEMRRGWLILQRDNPSDDRLLDDAVEIPVWFTVASNQ